MRTQKVKKRHYSLEPSK